LEPLLLNLRSSIRGAELQAAQLRDTLFDGQNRPLFGLNYDRRYRLHIRKGTDDVHPIHVHRNRLEINSIAEPTADVVKDVVMVGPIGNDDLLHCRPARS